MKEEIGVPWMDNVEVRIGLVGANRNIRGNEACNLEVVLDFHDY